MKPALSTELVTDEPAFAEPAPDWERLCDRCSAATPFQSHAWLHPWCLSYSRGRQLRLVLVREEGDLIAAAPLTLRRGPVPAWVPLGGSISDHTDVLIDDERAARAAAALAEGLSAVARTLPIDFREVRPGGAVERVYERWSGPRLRTPDSLCLELPAAPMDELVSRLPSGKAQRVRAKLRKLRTLGVEWHVVRPGQVHAALRRLLELHRLQRQGRKVTAEHLKPRFYEHLARSVIPMVHSGDALVTEFLIDGDVVAVDLTLLSRGLAGGCLYGAHPRLRKEKADVAVMLLAACTQHTDIDGLSTLSLLCGNEPYKLRRRPEPVANQRLLPARRRTAPLMSAVIREAVGRRHGKELLHRPRSRAGGGGPGTGPTATGGHYRVRDHQSKGRHSFPASKCSIQSPRLIGEQPAGGSDGMGTVGVVGRSPCAK